MQAIFCAFLLYRLADSRPAGKGKNFFARAVTKRRCHAFIEIEHPTIRTEGGVRMTRAYLATAAAVLALALAVFSVVSVLPI